MQLDMFPQVPERPQTVTEERGYESYIHAGTGKRCRQCGHCIRPHHYRPDWTYCNMWPSNRTQFGMQKVKPMRPACSQFVEKVNCKHENKKDLSQGLGEERHYYCSDCGSHWYRGKYWTRAEWEKEYR